MNNAYLSAVAVLAGSAVGALASVTTTWLTLTVQGRTDRYTREMTRKEHIYGQFIEEASRLFSDALTHDLDDASKLVSLYATVSKLRLFASPLVLSTADDVMDRIIQLYESPAKDIHAVLKAGGESRSSISFAVSARPAARIWRPRQGSCDTVSARRSAVSLSPRRDVASLTRAATRRSGPCTSATRPAGPSTWSHRPGSHSGLRSWSSSLGCATPVGIRRVSLSEVDRVLGENAVTGEGPSVFSRQILARLGLSTLYEDDPRAALEKLRAGLGGPDAHERLLALAELWFATARKSDDQGEYLAAAVCAYAYVFPATPPSTPPSPYDSRNQLVLEIYDRGITKGLALTGSSLGTELDPTPRQIQMPFGTFVLNVPEQEFHYGGYRIVHPVALGDLEIRGLRNRYRRSGAGVALAASIEPAKDSNTDPWVPPLSKVPVTAFVRLDDLAPDLAGAHGTLELYDSDETPTITVASATVPLASDPSAVLAYNLEGAPVWDFEIAGFRRSDLRLAGFSGDPRTGLSQPLSAGPDPGRVRARNAVESRPLGGDGERAAR